MEMMNKLLNNLSRTWNKLPKTAHVLQIQQGTGIHGLVTITSTSLVLHSVPYMDDMPVKQEIVLDDYLLPELISELNTMGYIASIDSEAMRKGLQSCRATVLLEVTNRPIIAAQVLDGFTSEVWQLLYPIARILENNKMDTSNALKQMLSTSAQGVWVDYWATFVNMKRLAGESDFALQKRIFMSLTNLKTNNIAIQQMIQYALNSTVKLEDLEPSLFSVTVDADYINIASYVHQLINDLRGAGIDYFLNYAKTNIEEYQSYFKDRYQVKFEDSDIPKTDVTLSIEEDEYGYYQPDVSFTLNRDELGTSEVMELANIRNPRTLIDEATMVFQQASSEVVPVRTEAVSRDYTSSLAELLNLATRASEVYSVLHNRTEDYFEPDIGVKGTVGFVLNYSETGSTGLLGVSDDRVQDRASMTLTLATNGQTIRSEVFDY